MAKLDISGVVVRDNKGRFLCVQEKRPDVYGKWNMPAGHVELSETPQQAAVREAREESGYDVSLIDSKPIAEEYNQTDERWFRVFRAEIVGGELHVDPNEVLDVKWLTFDEIYSLNEQGEIRAPWVYRAFEHVHSQL